MATKDYQELHEHLHKLVAKEIKTERDEAEKDDFQDLVEEIEDDLCMDIIPEGRDRHSVNLPTDDTVVSWNPDGTPLSLFGHLRWSFWVLDSLRTIEFGRASEELGLDLSSALCKPLVKFHKLICYFQLPGVDPYRLINSFRTLNSIASYSLHLCSLIKKNGYLYGNDNEFLGLSTMSVNVLRTELLDSIDRDEVARVRSLAMTINLWLNMSSLTSLPSEFSAPFTKKQMWDGNLTNKTYRYCVSKTYSFDAIEFDDLLQMFQTSKKYMDNYVDDVLFLGDIFDQIYSVSAEESATGTVPIFSSGRSENMWTSIINRQYAVDPDTGDAWIEPSVATGHGKPIKKGNLLGAVNAMESVCIFLLLIWGAMRRSELVTLKVASLAVDGKPLNQNQSALEQVKLGKDFKLTRVVTKTSKNPKGKEISIPLPRSGAQAFALLVDLYRKGRMETANPYLLPHGNYGYSRGRGYKENLKTSHVRSHYIYQHFLDFCILAGVKPYHPHRCRKTMPTLLINYDPKCIELIKDLLGHEDIQMTRRYLMSLPGIAEETRKIYVKAQSDSLANILTSAIEGKFAGPAGDRASMAIMDDIDAFKGKRMAGTIASLIETLIGSNFTVVRTPVSWCLRFQGRIPWEAPCLPPLEKRSIGEIPVPNFDKCDDWLCKFPGYTPDQLNGVRQRKAWAEKMGSRPSFSGSKAYYDSMANHWGRIVDQLENGRPDIVNLHLPEAFIAEAGGFA